MDGMVVFWYSESSLKEVWAMKDAKRPRVIVLNGKGLRRKEQNVISGSGRLIELIACYEETFDGSPEEAAQWMAGGSEIDAVLVTGDDFGLRVLPLLRPQTDLPIVVVGEGRSEDNVTWTGTCLTISGIADIVKKVIAGNSKAK